MDRLRRHIKRRPNVDWHAGQIADPVSRLRFLRERATVTDTSIPRQRSLARYLVPPVLLAVGLVFLLLHSPSRATVNAIVVHPAWHAFPEHHDRVPEVWLVESSGGLETYSNGLRIDDRFQVSNRPRSYLVFPAGGGAGVAGREPVGIVFHTTESPSAPFEAEQNRTLRRIGESLLEYVKRQRAYNFVIDRFGRVYRVVPEGDVANHAGYSVWADDQWLYINLNQSFLGISFEADTEPGQEQSRISEGQARSAAMLTEMLRSRYKIRAVNCVTHGQVSVNPSNMQAGYHTDWASGFPFHSLGLADNYARPLPALWAFGFETDAAFYRNGGIRLAASAKMAEDLLAHDARLAGVSPQAYRKALQKQYRERLSEVRHAGSEDAE